MDTYSEKHTSDPIEALNTIGEFIVNNKETLKGVFVTLVSIPEEVDKKNPEHKADVFATMNTFGDPDILAISMAALIKQSPETIELLATAIVMSKLKNVFFMEIVKQTARLAGETISKRPQL